MRIVPTALVSIAFLGAAISPGWCPTPADLTTPLSTSKSTTAAAKTKKLYDLHWRRTPQSGSRTYERQNKPESARLNPAINRLSGDGTGGGFVGGSRSNSGGAVPPGRRTPVGNAGTSMTNSQSGNATASSRMPIVSGGCPGCGKNDTVRQPR